METIPPTLDSTYSESFLSKRNFHPQEGMLWKLQSGMIFLCTQGCAEIEINLVHYSICPFTQGFLLPESIIKCIHTSEDFVIDFFSFQKSMFQEAAIRLKPDFFRFLRLNPCYVLPEGSRDALQNFMDGIRIIYLDTDNCFRNQIAKNHLQSFLLMIYDKVQRYFTQNQREGGTQQERIFKAFIPLVNQHCLTHREVAFYADKLCISTKYLTNICRSIGNSSPKMIIDDHATLEIKVLLQSTNLSMQEIADRLHFPDQSYLGRFFKRQVGISPTAYQKQYAGRNELRV